MTAYADFLIQKQRRAPLFGTVAADALPDALFPWQAAIVRWALKKGRAAIFADCGLGKTPMQLAWAHALGKDTLILAPLCVAEQTVREGQKFGIPVHYALDGAHVQPGITITNYERLDKFNVSDFSAVVLDESSILKAFDGKTRTKLIAAFQETPYRLCCSATPAPNDIAELANHAEFLGLMTRAEFLATWFVHDDAGWRMKRHAVQPFYRWMASWALALRSPADLGYDETGFVLPPLQISETIVDSPMNGGVLFPELGLHGIRGRLTARRDSLSDRLDAAVDLVGVPSEPWLIWCGLNEESDQLSRRVPYAVNVQGSDTYSEKTSAVEAFCRPGSDVRALISKVKILGYGLNFQHCARMIFLGLGDSYEQYYQAIRRCWRFGQKHAVDVHVIVGDAERAVVENVRRKEATADTLARELVSHMRDFEREEVLAC